LRKHFAKANAIYPKYLNEIELYNKTAYISLLNPNYSGKRLLAILNYLATHFKDPLMITAGYLYRYHYEMYTGCKQEAIELALAAEKKYIETQLYPALKATSLESTIKLSDWQSQLDLNEFKQSRDTLQHFYEHNSSFKLEIQTMAKNFIEKQYSQADNFRISKTDAIQCSINFLLEESMLFDCLINRGYEIDIYPGKHVTALNDIGSRYPDAPIGLRDRTVIELTIHRVGRKFPQRNVIKNDCAEPQ